MGGGRSSWTRVETLCVPGGLVVSSRGVFRHPLRVTLGRGTDTLEQVLEPISTRAITFLYFSFTFYTRKFSGSSDPH